LRAFKIVAPGGLGKLSLTQAADPRAPLLGEISVRVRASSLNFHDYLVVTGAIPAADGRIPMSDGSGEVIAVGDGVDGFAVGDKVMSRYFPFWEAGAPRKGCFHGVPGELMDGYAREIATAPASFFSHIPSSYSYREAATLVCAGLTAWHALVDGPVLPGATVLVLGTGGVSTFAVLFAKAMGATVIATSSSDEKLERMRSLGADHTINYRSMPKWEEAVEEITHGDGADHIMELGGAATLPQSINAAREGGHIAIIGALAGLKGPVPTVSILRKQLRVQGVRVGNAVQQGDMVRAIDANGIRPVIDKAYPMEELADAFRYQETAAHIGKICVDI
jgi:NADPH:quinone reductase-like Zn-dependent oxidoreductase